MKLRGIFAPIPTPFHDDGTLYLEALSENLEKWLHSSLDGLVVCGSNGELPFLTCQERVALTKKTKEIVQSRLPIVVGAHFPSTRETIDCSLRIADAGADALLLLPPHYFRGQNTMEVLTRYYTKVADSSPIPIVLYNMPANTGVNLPVDLILHLAEHPKIIGIKDTAGDITQLTHLCQKAPKHFSVFCGSGNFFLPSLSVGASGGTLAVANLYPNACHALWEAFEMGKLNEAKRLQYQLLPISEAVTNRFGVPGLKAAMDVKKLYGGPVREPLLPIGPSVLDKIIQIMEASGLDEWEGWR